MHMIILDCLTDADCAAGAVCTNNTCTASTDTPVCLDGVPSDSGATCVECTAADFGSCEPNDSCDEINNVCVGKARVFFFFFFFFFFF